MATQGNNTSLEIAQIRDNCLESFEPRFRDVVEGKRLPVDLEEYVQVKKAKEITGLMDFNSASRLLERVQEIDDMAINGQINPSVAEAVIVELLQNIEDIQMVRELER